MKLFSDENLRKLFGRKKKDIKPDLSYPHFIVGQNVSSDPKSIYRSIVEKNAESKAREQEKLQKTAYDLYNGGSTPKHMVEKLKLWEQTGVVRPTTMTGLNLPMSVIEAKLNEIIEELNKRA